MAGQNQYGGARFAKDVAGTTQQEVNLEIILEALNRPNARQEVADLINVFWATGQRKPQGSATEFNRQINNELGELPLPATALAGAKTAGLAALTHVRDAAERAWLGRRTNTLADLFVAPDSVAQIRAMAA